jgi:hypothetical protein
MTMRPVYLAAIGVSLALGNWVSAQNPPAAEPPATSQPEPAPRMELSPTKFDFGEVWQTVPVKREFTIKNTGQADLTIGAKSSCGCTVATTPKSPLPPGESTTFTITYDSKTVGDANKKVTLSTNDPAQASVDIPVVGKVKPVFKISRQDRIMLRDLELNSAERGELKLTNNFGRPLQLKLKDGQDFGHFDVSLQEIKPGLEYELVVVTRPPLELGWNQVNVTLETGASEVPTISIPISANAQPRVQVFPPMLAVNPENAGPVQKVVSVEYRVDMPIKITGVKPAIDSIKYELLPDESPAPDRKIVSHKIRLTLPAYAQVPEEGTRVEILTDDHDPQYQSLNVRIMKLKEIPRIRRIGPDADKPVPEDEPVKPTLPPPSPAPVKR